MSVDEINEMMKRDFPYLNFKGITQSIDVNSSKNDKKK